MGLFWRYNIGQSVADASARAEQGVMTAEEARARVLNLEAKVSKLTLVNHALFELIAERTGITEADLIDRVNEIDLRDGRMDGRPSPETPLTCEQCGRSYSRRHNHCFYCGHVNTVARAF
jgi:hypothetical protein